MNEPLRLRDDPDADTELRALLREASETPGIPAAMRQSLGAKVAATSLHASASLAVWKWVGVAALAASVGVGVWGARATPHRTPVARPVATVTTTARSPAPPPRAPPAVVASPTSQGVPAPRPTVAVTSPRAPHGRVRVAPSFTREAVVAPSTTTLLPASPQPSTPPTPPTSVVTSGPATGGPSSVAALRSAEHQLLDRARAAESAGRVDEALRLVSEHERTFPDGRLREEREAIALESLSRAGRREDVRRRGASFLTSWPRSLYAPRVRTLLRAADDLQMGPDR